MSINDSIKNQINSVLKQSIRRKLECYKPETTMMPFHTRLLGKDRLALYSFIHSLNTNFGTSIFEPVSISLSKERFKNSVTQSKAGEIISSEALRAIQSIMTKLSTAENTPNKTQEIEMIRKVCQSGQMQKIKLTRIDVKLEDENGRLYFFDIKTAKPNAGNFKEFKRTLLEWVAAVLATNPKAEVQTYIAIPYNPYEPQPYSRWTMRGMLDLDNELKVAEEFWDFIGGEGAYEDLLNCFEQVGYELRDELDDYFKRFANNNK